MRTPCPLCGLELSTPTPPFCPRATCGVALRDGSPPRPATFRLVGHYSLFVLPFAFDEDADGAAARRVADSGRWQPRLYDTPEDVDRTEYFLPYIRRLLFPRPGELGCRRFAFDLDRLGPSGERGVSLTLRGRDARIKVNRTFALRLEDVELIVFPYRVGFLVLRVALDDEGATYFDQMEATAFLRTLAPLYRDFRMPTLEGDGRRFDVPRLLAFLLAEFGADKMPTDPEAAGSLPVRPTYDDRTLVYTFSCLDKTTCLEDRGRCEALLRKAALIGFDDDDDGPPPRDDESQGDAWLRGRRQGFSKDGGGLVVFDTDRYHERYAGAYHATYYFDVFLLAALQRATLLALFERLADVAALTTAGAAGRRALGDVRRDLLRFKNQCGFSQITNRERGLVLWKKWQKALETKTLFQEVNEQSAELDSYLQGRHRERAERLLKVGGLLAASLPAAWNVDARLGLLALAAAAGWFLWARQDAR